MTTPYAEVIGDPVDHSLSPAIHRFWLEKLGIDADYRATRVTPDGLEAYFAERRADTAWRGCNVTIPHKRAVMALLSTSTREAEKVGAVNTIRPGAAQRLHGRNADVEGIWRALKMDMRDKHVSIVGTGGAARAAVYAMRGDAASISIHARSVDEARRIIEQQFVSGKALPLEVAPEADVLINATPLGMAGFPPLAIDLTRLPEGALVFDMVYIPIETDLLRRARSRGLRTVDGLEMLMAQASLAFSVFYKAVAPTEFNGQLRSLLVPYIS